MNDPSHITEIIEGCQAKRRASQEELYRLYYGYAMSICIRYSKTEEEAAEILNSSFLKVFNKIDQISEPNAFKWWLRRIVINTSIDHKRKYENLNEDSYESAKATEKAAEAPYEGDLIYEDILKAIRSLPRSQQVVFNMYVFEGYKHKEIGEKINIAESSSRAILANANKKLRKILTKHLELATIGLLIMNDDIELYEFIRQSANSYTPNFNELHWKAMEALLSNSITKVGGIIQSGSTSTSVQIASTSQMAGFSTVIPYLTGAVVTIGGIFGANEILKVNKKETSNDTIEINHSNPIDVKKLSIKGHPIPSLTLLKQQVLSEKKVTEVQKANSNTPSSKPEILSESTREPQPEMILQSRFPTELAGVSAINMEKIEPLFVGKRRFQIELVATPSIGYKRLYKFFDRNTKYPEELKGVQPSGEVVVNFIINERGRPQDIEIFKGFHELLDAEAIRLIKRMPSWDPGEADGEPIPSKHRLAIFFRARSK